MATASRAAAVIKQWRNMQGLQTLGRLCVQLMLQGEKSVVMGMRRNWMAWKLKVIQ
jgi:hypothetical protein